MVEKGMCGFMQALTAWDMRQRGFNWDAICYALDCSADEAKALIDSAEAMNRMMSATRPLFDEPGSYEKASEAARRWRSKGPPV